MKSLDAKCNRQFVQKLSSNESGKISFQYDSDWIANGFAISISLHLQYESFDRQKYRPFFEGSLPKDTIGEEVARNLGVSSRSDLGLLREIGGDCAGAIIASEILKMLHMKSMRTREATRSSLSGCENFVPQTL